MRALMDDGRHLRFSRATEPNSGGPSASSIFSRRLFTYLDDRPRRAVETAEPYAVGSTIGSVRSKNEDAAAIVRARFPDHPSRSFDLALVCDGMGGMADGRHAALMAASSFVGHLITADRHDSPNQRLAKALHAAQLGVFRDLGGEGGTTLSALYVDQSAHGWFVHVGDSRIYGITHEGALRQLTREDTLGAMLNRESERRPDFGRLVQFVGIEGDLDPQIAPVNVRDYRGFLVTSDGAHGAPPGVLSTVSQHSKSGPDLVRKLLNLADALGGVDNATAVFLPSDLQSDTVVSDRDDLSVSILCASGDHDIWIPGRPFRPELGGQSRLTALPGVAKEQEVSSNLNAADKKKRAKRRKKPKADELPLEEPSPIAKVDFSDGNGEDGQS